MVNSSSTPTLLGVRVGVRKCVRGDRAGVHVWPREGVHEDTRAGVPAVVAESRARVLLQRTGEGVGDRHGTLPPAEPRLGQAVPLLGLVAQVHEQSDQVGDEPGPIGQKSRDR